MSNQVKAGQRWLATDGALNCVIHVVYIDEDSIRLACYDHLAESVPWGITNDTLTSKDDMAETMAELTATHLLMYDGESPDDTRNRVYDNKSDLNCPHCQAKLDTKYWHTEWAYLCEQFVVNCDECDEEVLALAFEAKTQIKYALAELKTN